MKFTRIETDNHPDPTVTEIEPRVSAVSAKKPKKITRQAIIVLGMHRTGTSAVSGVLAKLGVQAPRSLMPPTQDNPKGYWESTAIMNFNDRILESAGTRWSDWDRFNTEWINSPLRDAFVNDLSTVLQDEYGNAPLILIKDPRMCRLFPFWATALELLGVTPKVLITVRHPAEVIKSLEVRDHLTENQSKLIWLRHLLDAEYSSRGMQRVFVRYADILASWQVQTDKVSNQLDVKWPRASGATSAEIDAYLAPELRHHVATGPIVAQNPGIASWVATAYQVMDSLAGGVAQPAALRALDEIREEFNRTSAIYAPVVHEQRIVLEEKISGLGNELTTLSQELNSINHAHEALGQENIANYRLYDDARKALEEMEKRGHLHEAANVAVISKHEIELAELTAQIQAREKDRNEMASRYEAMQADLTARMQATEEARAELASQYQVMQADLTAQVQAKEVARSELASQYQVMQAELGNKLYLAEMKHSELESSHRADMAKMDARLRTEIRQLKNAVRLAEESAQERSAESAELTKWVLSLEEQLADKEVAIRGERDCWNSMAEEANRTISECNVRIRALESSIQENEAKTRVLARELEAQASLLAEYHVELERVHSGKYWKLAASLRRLTNRGGGQESKVDHEVSDIDVLRRSSLFDRDWYLSRYPDVRSRKMDPISHYLKYGAAEGRDPCAAFSTTGYLSRYPDVGSASINPLVHYLKHGRKEGRAISGGDVKTNE